jgi:hypothetical protein
MVAHAGVTEISLTGAIFRTKLTPVGDLTAQHDSHKQKDALVERADLIVSNLLLLCRPS